MTLVTWQSPRIRLNDEWEVLEPRLMAERPRLGRLPDGLHRSDPIGSFCQEKTFAEADLTDRLLGRFRTVASVQATARKPHCCFGLFAEMKASPDQRSPTAS